MIGDLWYKNAIFYSLDVGTFMDGDGDGVGDFRGLLAKITHLEALGVDAVWLAPFQPSPNRDNGYDISDYYGVDPRHGSAGDFVELVHHARKHGIKVVLDLVINHTSVDHPWFRAARRDKDSPYRGYYVWADHRPKNADEGVVFPGVQMSTWTRDEQADAWYFHRFYEHQPDLDQTNPAVRAEIRRIIGYWLQLGADAFRLDALPFLLEDLGPRSRKMNYRYLEELRSFVQWRRGDAVLLGEANVTPDETREYFRDGRGVHLLFNFWVNQHLFLALATEQARPLADALEATRELPPGGQWAHFLRNHDELDLGRLSEEDRQRVFARFGPDPSMQLYGRGIRRRLAPMIGSRSQLELAYSLLLALPGTPVLRYGDEIGMGDDLSLSERDSVRTPMQWSDTANGGFSSARRLVHPVIADGPYGARHVNVERQRREPGSLLTWTSRMVRLRKECPEVGWGEFEVLDVSDPAVLALRYRWNGDVLVTVHALGHTPCEVEVPADGPLADLLALEVRAPRRGKVSLALPAHGYGWYREQRGAP